MRGIDRGDLSLSMLLGQVSRLLRVINQGTSSAVRRTLPL